MDVHLRDLRYFVAVAEELNFTRAATERLFISQPALSKQIRQLEATLRTSLFDRDRRTVALTDAGAALLKQARPVLAEWAAAERAVSIAAAERATTLTVGFQTRIGRGLIPRVTADLADQLPDWKLSFRQVPWGDATAGLFSRRVDVAITWLPLAEPGSAGDAALDSLSWRVIATEPRWVALPAGHRLARRRRLAFVELADEPFVALPASAGALRQFWLATAERDRPAHIAAVAHTAEEAFEAVASGLGVTLLAQGNAAIYRRDDVVCRAVTGLPPSELAVAWRTEDTRAAIGVFVEACVRCWCEQRG